MSLTAREKMTRARAALILDHPWFGALSLRLRLVPDETIPTAATDGTILRYSPSFIDSLSDLELRGVIAHQVLHCATGHCWRRGNRDARRWNMAADYAINPFVYEAGLLLPGGALRSDQYRGMSAEEIYASLPDPTESSDDSAGNDPGGCGGVDDAPADGDHAAGDHAAGDRAATETEWRVAAVQAAHAAQMMGSLPGIAARLLAEYTRPALDWRTLLADFVCRAARNDYDWQRPSARYLSRGIVLPGLRSSELPEVVIAVDTSGSIDDETLAAFCGAVSDVLAAYQTTAHVVTCDAAIQTIAEYTSADLPITVDCAGGGGTDFSPVFRWVAERGIEPAVLIYLTDLYGLFPDDEPAYPVLWVCTTKNENAPFGEIIRI